MSGEIVVTAVWRFPSTKLGVASVNEAVDRMKGSLVETKLAPSSISGYAVEDVETERSMGYERIDVLAKER